MELLALFQSGCVTGGYCGCVSSPEMPTAALAFVGTIAWIVAQKFKEKK